MKEFRKLNVVGSSGFLTSKRAEGSGRVLDDVVCDLGFEYCGDGLGGVTGR